MKLPFISRRRVENELKRIETQTMEMKEFLQMRISDWLKQQAELREYIITGTQTPGMQQQIDEGYKSVIWYYAAANLVARNIANIPLKLFRPKAEKDEEVFGDKAPKPLQLLTINPNPIANFKSPYQLREFFALMLICTGNAYLYVPRGEATSNPLFIRNLLSQNITPELTGKSDDPVQYKYIGNDGKTIVYQKKEIIHWMLVNPDSEIEGLSPIQVARYAIDNFNFSKRWNNALLTNEARPSGALVTPTILPDSERLRLKREIDEDWSGFKNVGKPRLLQGGLTWQQFSISPKDMDWLQSQKLSMREICAILGVPGELLGDAESKTYANAKEARIAFYETTIIPLVNREIDLYNAFFFPQGDFYFRPDLSQVDALKKNESEIINSLSQAWWLTINQRLERMGLETLEGDIYNTPLIPATYMPATMMGAGKSEEL